MCDVCVRLCMTVCLEMGVSFRSRVATMPYFDCDTVSNAESGA